MTCARRGVRCGRGPAGRLADVGALGRHPTRRCQSRRTVCLSEGIGHCFCVISDDATLCHLSSQTCNPASEHGVHPLDPGLAVNWPAGAPLLSEYMGTVAADTGVRKAARILGIPGTRLERRAGDPAPPRPSTTGVRGQVGAGGLTQRDGRPRRVTPEIVPGALRGKAPRSSLGEPLSHFWRIKAGGIGSGAVRGTQGRTGVLSSRRQGATPVRSAAPRRPTS
ncbi:dTDP-4-dehydrorhamnose 3,5-epimerase family protein [Streptomyces sp. NPDC004542]|uniref:dTDP-4-dehydrorhamnose 3,5-epimerase family protein n=1 Tax=Streptomyces sp. NPDC004542 TaxID=3154281 RepID=UPI0033B7220B